MSKYGITSISTSKIQPKRSLFIFFRPEDESYVKNFVDVLFFFFSFFFFSGGERRRSLNRLD